MNCIINSSTFPFNFRIQIERGDRNTKAENSRQNAEITSLRQRLDRSDADLLHARRENLRLCDQISSLEKEVRTDVLRYINHIMSNYQSIPRLLLEI